MWPCPQKVVWHHLGVCRLAHRLLNMYYFQISTLVLGSHDQYICSLCACSFQQLFRISVFPNLHLYTSVLARFTYFYFSVYSVLIPSFPFPNLTRSGPSTRTFVSTHVEEDWNPIYNTGGVTIGVRLRWLTLHCLHNVLTGDMGARLAFSSQSQLSVLIEFLPAPLSLKQCDSPRTL